MGALPGPTGAIFAKLETPGAALAAGEVAGGLRVEVEIGLLLNRTLAPAFGAAVGPAALIAGEVAWAAGVVAVLIAGALRAMTVPGWRDG